MVQKIEAGQAHNIKVKDSIARDLGGEISTRRNKLTGIGEITGIAFYGRNLVKNEDALLKLFPLPKLRYANFAGSAIGEKTADALANCSNLEDLILRDADFSDRHLLSFETLTNLRSLDLSNTCITNDSLKVVCNCKKLESLSVAGTYVTEDGVEQLEQCLPGLTIFWSPVKSEEVRQAVIAVQRTGRL